jgi:glycine/D-amino acid oxidase-like deaminating enzyme
MMAANRLWRGLEAELGADVEWIQGGNLALAATPDRLALLEAWTGTAREHGLDTRMLSPREVEALVPGIAGGWLGGLYTPSDGHAEPRKATWALAHAAMRHGARLYERVAVEGVEAGGGAVHGVVTEAGLVRARTVVCAAGAWSARLLRPLGLALPQRWVRATVARTTPLPSLTRVGVWGPTVSFRQRRDGTLNIAAAGAADHDVTLESLRHARLFLPNYWRNRRLFRFHVGRPLVRDLTGLLPGSAARRHPATWDRDLDPEPNPAKVRRSLAELRRLLPSIGPVEVTRAWAGYIDATPDAIPVIGEAGPLGLVVVTGFTGHGFAMGPIVGRLVAELITDGKPSLDLRAFRFSRFAEGLVGRPRSVL